MKLQNNLPHMRNQSVKVDGTVYPIDGDGITEEITNPSDLKKLLMDRSSWKRYFPVPEVAELEESTEETVLEVETAPELEPSLDVATEPEVVTNTDTGNEPDAVNDSGSPDTEEETELDRQYPDPTEENTLKELKELADVYQVKYKDQPNKKTLIKRIMEAMYPEE